MDFQTTDIIEITPTNQKSEADAVSARLNALTLSKEGTIPGSRNFGLPNKFLSKPPTQARNIFAIELSEKAATYIPEISIASVTGEVTGAGMEDMIIHVERSSKS